MLGRLLLERGQHELAQATLLPLVAGGFSGQAGAQPAPADLEIAATKALPTSEEVERAQALLARIDELLNRSEHERNRPPLVRETERAQRTTWTDHGIACLSLAGALFVVALLAFLSRRAFL